MSFPPIPVCIGGGTLKFGGVKIVELFGLPSDGGGWLKLIFLNLGGRSLAPSSATGVEKSR